MKFIEYISKETENRRYLFIALIGSILLLIAFKSFYPYGDFFSDSNSYILAAMANLDISTWPIGYSKFIRWFHFITYSDTALTAFQYLLYVISAIYFFFTVLFLYQPVKTNRVILFIFLFFNPLFLYICNYVNSDGLFLALSLLWFTELLWLLQSPNAYHIVAQAVLLFACFTVRNNAYIYPILAIAVFAVTKLNLRQKIAGASLGLLFIVPFVIHTRNAAFKLTGTKQFSLFTGWQLANNALYMYEYADTAKQLSATGRELDTMSIWFYSIVPKDFRSEYLLPNPGNFFIQYHKSPLKLYLYKHYQMPDDYAAIAAWGKASAAYAEFGKYLILHNKKAYFYKFLVPNAKNYFVPHLEKLSLYNLGDSTVSPVVSQWFHYKNNNIKSASAGFQGKLLFIMPYLFLILNAYWLINMIIYLNRGNYKSATITNKGILLSGLFFIMNFLFCVFATIIVMRYQVFPMIISLTYCLFLSEELNRKTAVQLPKLKKEFTGPEYRTQTN